MFLSFSKCNRKLLDDLGRTVEVLIDYTYGIEISPLNWNNI